ncbi:MAG: hypothetical protein SYC29_04670 [Planctomycetota bacterium]|nr:hypothetical protein [Planctomycetota bacterium]
MFDAPGGPPTEAAIPIAVYREIDKLVTLHRTRRDREKRQSRYHAMFRALIRRTGSRESTSAALVRRFEQEHKWFKSQVHFPREPKEPVPERELHAHFERFETILYAPVGSFFTVKSELDEILHAANQ